MKKCSTLFTVSFFLFIFLIGCKDPGSINPANDEKNIVITESKLPPGKPVIETERITYNVQDSIGPMGNNNGDDGITPSNGNVKTRLDTLKNKFKNLLVFHADDTMQVGQPRLATLILANDRSIPSLKQEVMDESDALDDNYKVDTTMEFGNKMKARLISFSGSQADKSFEIEPIGDDIQSFNNKRNKIIWQWRITPLKPGQQSLKLSVQIVNEDEAVTLGARNIDVVIFAKPENVWKQVGTFLEGHQWLFSVLLLPIIVAWLTTRMKNKAIVNQYNGPANTQNQKPETHGGRKRRR